MLLVLLLAVSACTGQAGTPQDHASATIAPRPVDPGFVHGTDRGGIDRLAATVVTDVQKYWAEQFPAQFGAPWRDLDGGFFSVDTTTERDDSPPCSGDTKDVEGNAYYCASVDAVAWDRAALLPVLREHYGETAVAVVLAHEIGHAVQQRSGMNVGGVEHMMNPVRTEAMADCYAGAFVRSAADGHSDHLRIDSGQLDSALQALIVFRDPIGSAQSSADAHGTAFERVSAFQDGYRDGPKQCGGVADEATNLTTPDATEGNEPLDDVLRSSGPPAFFTDLVNRHGRQWTPPPVRTAADPAGHCPTADAPIDYCAQPPGIVVNHEAATALHRDIGDQASTTLLASRYATAALDALHRPLTGPEPARQTACLTGAYTGSLSKRADAALSPGDLDEAVEGLLGERGGTTALTGFDRVAAFRAGAVGGADACGI